MSGTCFTSSVLLIGCRGRQTSCVRAVLHPVLLRSWSVRANPKMQWKIGGGGGKKAAGESLLEGLCKCGGCNRSACMWSGAVVAAFQCGANSPIAQRVIPGSLVL